MSLFLLTETSAGYALLKAKDKKLLKRKDISEDASSAEGVSNLYVQLSRSRWKISLGRADSLLRGRKIFCCGRRC
jgi:hypothetical protein